MKKTRTKTARPKRAKVDLRRAAASPAQPSFVTFIVREIFVRPISAAVAFAMIVFAAGAVAAMLLPAAAELANNYAPAAPEPAQRVALTERTRVLGAHTYRVIPNQPSANNNYNSGYQTTQ